MADGGGGRSDCGTEEEEEEASMARRRQKRPARMRVFRLVGGGVEPARSGEK